MQDAARKILIIRLSAIGDVLRVLPAFQVLRKNYPEASFGWVTEEASADILRAHPDIDEVFVFPKKAITRKLSSPLTFFSGLQEFFAFMKPIRAGGYDLTFDFHGLFKSGIISLLSRASRRVGFTMPFCREGNYLFNNLRFHQDSKRVSRIRRNLNLLEKFGLSSEHERPVIHIPAADREAVQKFFRQQQINPKLPIIAVHPGTSPITPYKRWDPYRYAVVADTVIEAHAAQVIFTWAGAELDMVKSIVGQMKYRAIVAPRTQNLCQLAEIFRLSDLYLGSDTGPMHLAAFAGTPVIGLFGPTDPVVNEPYSRTPHIILHDEVDCAPCRKRACPRRDCMKGIREESVIRAIQIMLDSFKLQKAVL
ncbi:MAG: glycosyltransferase family 9 protein [Deltaproteobacteria bacterium]|nr:glycosyltransferase family 9 protein [Deltaproteobacteria bacterium]